MTDTPTLAVLGTGALGSALARAALGHGITTVVWNRTAARTGPLAGLGAHPVATPGAAVAAAPVVVAAVSTYADVRSALAGADLDGRLLVNLSSGTPADASVLAAEVHRRGGHYLDGAAMGGTEAIGDPSAMFFYSGDGQAFDRHRPVFDAFGSPVFLGTDPATASAYDTAVLGMILGFLTAGYQALALLAGQQVPTTSFASVIGRYWPFVLGLFDKQARQLHDGAVTADDGTVDVYLAAVRHLIDTGASIGVDTTVSDAVADVLARASSAGYGADGLPVLARTVLAPAGVR